MDNIQKVNHCYVCANECVIKDGSSGLCGKYSIKDGEIVETTPDKYLVVCSISMKQCQFYIFTQKASSYK